MSSTSRFVLRTARLLVAALALAAPSVASAQPAGLAFAVRDAAAHAPAEAPDVAPRAHDPFFPGAGRVAVAISTGVPFAATGEVAVEPWEGLSIAALGGVADNGTEFALGGRARVRLARSGAFDVVLTLPLLYYPPSQRRDDEPWLLTNPSLVVAHRWHGASVYGGAGFLVASCTDSLAAALGGAREPETRPRSHPMVDGAWNTFHAGGAFAAGSGIDVFLESSLMMNGLVPSKTYAEKIGPPFLAQVGVRHVF